MARAACGVHPRLLLFMWRERVRGLSDVDIAWDRGAATELLGGGEAVASARHQSRQASWDGVSVAAAQPRRRGCRVQATGRRAPCIRPAPSGSPWHPPRNPEGDAIPFTVFVLCNMVMGNLVLGGPLHRYVTLQHRWQIQVGPKPQGVAAIAETRFRITAIFCRPDLLRGAPVACHIGSHPARRHHG